jgi:hypothetical protein
VFAGNKTGPPERLDHNWNGVAEIDRSLFPRIDPGRDDLVFLNIRENMNEGKSPSWMKAGLAISDAFPSLRFDYIAKVDTDTLICPDAFFDWTRSNVPPSPGIFYGGWKGCNEAGPVNCTYKLRKLDLPRFPSYTYMGGRLYFLSIGLARRVSAMPADLLYKKGARTPEDIDIAARIYANGQNDVHVADMHNDIEGDMFFNPIFSHPVKFPYIYEQLYNQRCLHQNPNKPLYDVDTCNIVQNRTYPRKKRSCLKLGAVRCCWDYREYGKQNIALS